MNTGQTGKGFWRSFSIFEDFDDQALTALSEISVHRTWHAGEVIFQRGDDGDYMIALASGRIKLSLITPNGRELVLRQVEGGELFGDLAVLDRQTRSADAAVVTAAEGYAISRRPFMELVEHSSNATGAVFRYLCQRLRDTTEQLESIALYDLTARAARFFLATLRQIHGNDLPERANLQLPLSQSDIAEILGASRPKVNRAIVSLEENGGIRRCEDGIIECNSGRLRWIADPTE